jgi:hypothetical protein
MFLFYVWNSFIALLNLIVIAIITLRSEINVTSMLIVAQCLMRDTLSCLNRIDKIGYGRLYMREDNLCITDGLIYCHVSPNI